MAAEPYYSTRAKFHADPKAQKLLRQFMSNKGEGGGAGKSSEFRAGYVYAFELSETQKRAVDALRKQYEGLELHQAIDLVLSAEMK
jgi:hypothetical protein